MTELLAIRLADGLGMLSNDTQRCLAELAFKLPGIGRLEAPWRAQILKRVKCSGPSRGE